MGLRSSIDFTIEIIIIIMKQIIYDENTIDTKTITTIITITTQIQIVITIKLYYHLLLVPVGTLESLSVVVSLFPVVLLYMERKLSIN